MGLPKDFAHPQTPSRFLRRIEAFALRLPHKMLPCRISFQSRFVCFLQMQGKKHTSCKSAFYVPTFVFGRCKNAPKTPRAVVGSASGGDLFSKYFSLRLCKTLCACKVVFSLRGAGKIALWIRFANQCHTNGLNKPQSKSCPSCSAYLCD